MVGASIDITAVTYRVTGERTSETKPSVCYTLHPFKLTQDDEHALATNPTVIPQPLCSPSFDVSFSLPIGFTIRHVPADVFSPTTNATSRHFQLLSANKYFLVVDGSDALIIYIESLTQLNSAVAANAYKTKLYHERIGKDFVLAFDETRRAMAIFAVNNVRLTFMLKAGIDVLCRGNTSCTSSDTMSTCQSARRLAVLSTSPTGFLKTPGSFGI